MLHHTSFTTQCYPSFYIILLLTFLGDNFQPFSTPFLLFQCCPTYTFLPFYFFSHFLSFYFALLTSLVTRKSTYCFWICFLSFPFLFCLSFQFCLLFLFFYFLILHFFFFLSNFQTFSAKSVHSYFLQIIQKLF